MAIERFTQALDKDLQADELSVVYAFRAMSYGATYKYEEGLSDADTAIDLEARNAFAYYIRGLIHYDLGEEQSAIDDLERSLELGLEADARDFAESILVELR